MLKALIFDFDGLILDTETPEVLAWQSIYKDHGFELPLHEWEQTIGGYGISNFDAAEHLSVLSSGRLDSVSLRSRYRKEADAMIHANPILPGVISMIEQAKEAGLPAVPVLRIHGWIRMRNGLEYSSILTASFVRMMSRLAEQNPTRIFI
jgi:beta-phosphoglucomutase-like phosphatase (HAD superfamily)